MNIKKYISVLLYPIIAAAALSLPVFAEETDGAAGAEQEAQTADNNNYEAAKVLTSLGLIDEPNEKDDWSQKIISKGEFVKTALALTDYSEDTALSVILPWEGYESGTEYYSAYAYAYSNGYIQDGDEIGDASDLLTFDFAKNFMLKLMGYYPQVSTSHRSAAENALVKNAKSNEDGTLSLNGVYTMLYAATKTDCYHLESIDGEAGYVLRDGRTVITYSKNIYMIKGKVNATCYASVTGAKADKGEIIINSDKFEYDDPSFDMYLGKTVEGYAYIKEGDTAKLLYLDTTSRSADIVINGEDFVSYSSNKVEYETSGGRKKYTVVDDPIIIYNGKQLKSGEYSDEIFDITDGDVTLVTNNGKVGVIIVNKYKNLVIGTVDAENLVVYDAVYSSVKLNLDIDDLSLKTPAGTETEVSSLKSGNILTYAQSLDGKHVTGIVGGTVMSGKAMGIDTNEDGSVTISGKEYPFAAEIKNIRDTIRMSVSYTFYINVNGRLVAIESQSGTTGLLAYMTTAIVDQDDNDTAKIRVIKPEAMDYEDGVWLKCRDKVSVDGKMYRNEGILTALKAFNGGLQLPVVYSLTNDGLVSSIDTPHYNSANEAEETLRLRHSGEEDGEMYSKTALGWGYRDMFDGKYIMDYDGMVVQKAGDTDILVADYVRNDSHYKMDLYGFGTKSPLVYFAVINDSSLADPAFETSLAAVQDIYRSTNEENEVVTYIELVIDGKESKLEVDPDREQIISAAVDAGDLVRYAVNGRNRVAKIELVLDYSDRSSKVGYQNYTFLNNSSARIAVGMVYDIFKSNSSKTGSNSNIIQFAMNMGDIENSLEAVFARGGCVYRYKMTGSGSSRKVEMSELNAAEIKTYKNVGSEADIVVLKSSYNIPSNIYIVSND